MGIIKELNHVALRTDDLEATRHFYVDVLGGKIIRDLKNAEGVSYTYYFQLAEGVIEVFGGKDNLGYQHIAFLTSDYLELYSLCDELKANGCQFTDGPRRAGSGIGHLAFFKDESGVIFELIERKEDIRIPGLKNEHIEEFACISICVPAEKKDACDAFYRNTLGLQKKAEQNRKAYYSYGPDTIEAVTAAAEKPLSHIVFRVKDCAELKAYLESQGYPCPQPEKAEDGSHVINYIGGAGELIKFMDAPSLA